MQWMNLDGIIYVIYRTYILALCTDISNQCAMPDTNKRGQLVMYAMWYETEKLFKDEGKWSFS